jgi:hypothetical protein
MSTSDSNQILGIIKDGSFFSTETKKMMTLTTVHMQEARSRESGKIDLSQYEGKAILVSYQQISDDWVWGTEIIETAGLILALLIRKVFDLS